MRFRRLLSAKTFPVFCWRRTIISPAQLHPLDKKQLRINRQRNVFFFCFAHYTRNSGHSERKRWTLNTWLCVLASLTKQFCKINYFAQFHSTSKPLNKRHGFNDFSSLSFRPTDQQVIRNTIEIRMRRQNEAFVKWSHFPRPNSSAIDWRASEVKRIAKRKKKNRKVQFKTREISVSAWNISVSAR